MKWKTDPPKPKLGDTRKRIKFAWWPTHVGEYTVWLESYVINEIYTRVVSNIGSYGDPEFVEEWMEHSKDTCYYYI